MIRQAEEWDLPQDSRHGSRSWAAAAGSIAEPHVFNVGTLINGGKHEDSIDLTVLEAAL